MLGSRAVAGAHEDTLFEARIPAALQINQFVTHHETLCEVDAKFLTSIEEELRGGLATTAGHIRRFGGDINFFKTHFVPSQFAQKMLVNALRVRHGKIAAADTGLIGNDE